MAVALAAGCQGVLGVDFGDEHLAGSDGGGVDWANFSGGTVMECAK